MKTYSESCVDDLSILVPEEALGNGIWPRSFPLWAAAFYIALFIIRPWEQIFPSLATIHFERSYAIALMLIVMTTRGFRLQWSLQTAAVVLFLAALGIAGIFAWRPELSWNAFYVYLILVFFYFVIVSVVTTPYELVFIVTCYIVVMAIYLAKSLQGFVVYGGSSAVGITRLVGIERTFGDPNYLAESIVVSLPMSLFLYRTREQFTHTWPAVWRRWFVLGIGGYLILALISLVMTNSRAGMAAFVLFVGMVALRGKNMSQKIIRISLAFVLLLAIWFVMPTQYQDRLWTLWDPDSGPAYAKESAEGRSAGFHAGLEAFRRFPLTGVGPGSLMVYRVAHIDGVALATHSLPGQLLGGTGLVGTFAFLLLIGATFLNCRRIGVQTRGSDHPTLAILAEFAFAVRTSLLLLLFEGLALHNVYRFNYLWYAAFALLAAQFAADICAREEAFDEASDPYSNC